MPTAAEIKALLDATQVSLDAEQARVAELLAEKDTTIATLNAQSTYPILLNNLDQTRNMSWY